MRMKRNTFNLIISFALIVGFAFITFLFIYRNNQSQSLPISLSDFSTSEETEEYAVYSALLEKLFVKDDVKLLVIRKQTLFSINNYFIRTAVEESFSDMKKLFSSVSEDAFRDYRIKNQYPSILSSKFILSVKYVFTDEFEFNKDKDAAWIASFFEKYPDARGIIQLSKIGFNKDRTEAFVFAEFICSPLCSGGNNILLEKNSGVWKVKEKFEGWKS